MAVIWLTGFEHGVATPTANGGGLFNTVNGSASIQGTTKRTGNYALKIDQSAATEYVAKTISGSPTVIVGRFYFYYGSLPDGDSDIFSVTVGPTAKYAYLHYNPTDSSFRFGFNGSTSDTASSVVPVTGQWYRVDFRINVSSASFTIDWAINGTAQTQHTYTGTTGQYVTAVTCGSRTAKTATFYIDDVVITDASGDYPLGSGGVIALVPTADGTHAAGTNVIEDNAGNDIGGSYPAWSLLDEIPAGTSDYVRQYATGASNYAEVLFGDTTQSAFDGVMAYLAYTSSGTQANSAITKILRTDATEITVYSGDMSESSLFYKSAVITAPTGGWTQTEVNALKARVGFASDASPYPYWHGLLLEVAYREATGTQYTSTVSGSLSSAGAAAKQAKKTASGSVGMTGAAMRAVSRALAGSLGAAGTALKRTARGLVGSLSSSGVVSVVRTRLVMLAGSLSLAGTAVKRSNKLAAGGMGASGAVGKQTRRLIAGSLTSAGSLVKQARRAVVGGLSITGAVLGEMGARMYSLAMVGALTLSGTASRATNRALAGTLTGAGSMAKQTGRALAGALSSLGAAVGSVTAKTYTQALAGAVTMGGALVKQTGRMTGGAVAAVGGVAKGISRMLTGLVSLAGAIVRMIINLPTPETRTYLIPAEGRTAVISGENRAVVIDMDHRTTLVSSESRIVTIGG